MFVSINAVFGNQIDYNIIMLQPLLMNFWSFQTDTYNQDSAILYCMKGLYTLI